ncbi:MAG TPA: hypothetical protein DDW42_01620 [Desulfobacteraceae bacterium]|nr:hypothetical protein [Desulfobacteraceae bacterium]
MKKEKDLTGLTFGRLTALRPGERKGKQLYWICLCECGNEVNVNKYALTSGHTKSCGCLFREVQKKINTTHGGTYSEEYTTWCSMKQRCYYVKNKRYKDYGGRGIKVCEKWKNDFTSFLNDMGKRPNGMSIERKNNDGDYEPSNCKWATGKQQGRNNSNNNLIKILGETKTMVEWSEDERCKVSYVALRMRIHRGWDPERAVLQR